jgi:peptide/nickel transport system substrate-binding protein
MLLCAAIAFTGTAQPVKAAGTLRVAMTLADIPLFDGAPDQGTEGIRFAGYTVFDSLVEWDLDQTESAKKLRPALATEWSISPTDNTRWIFKLRHGVKFQDGSDFNADAVVFTFDRATKESSPEFDATAQRQVMPFIESVKSIKKIDDYTVEVDTKHPDAFLPFSLAQFLIVSPAQWEKLGRDWSKFRNDPSGTGPWKLALLVPHQRAELVANTDYWDKSRIPKLDRLVLLPLPEASARAAAILSGRVDWAESPPPETIDRMKKSGIVISTTALPQFWPYTLSLLPDSPFHDIRVRKAINLAIDRDGMVKLLRGLARPSIGNFPPDSPWYGNPSFKIRYDPEEAKRLLAEAGYGPGHPLNLKFAISTAGSGQMYPLVMNEFVQENLRAVGVNLDLQVLEWEALRGRRKAGAQAPVNKGIDAINNSYSNQDPYIGLLRYIAPEELAPHGSNWGGINDPQTNALLTQVRAEFDPEKQDKLIAQIHTIMVDQAYFVWVVHDVGPLALSPKVHGLIRARSWYVDFSPLSIN